MIFFLAPCEYTRKVSSCKEYGVPCRVQNNPFLVVQHTLLCHKTALTFCLEFSKIILRCIDDQICDQFLDLDWLF